MIEDIVEDRTRLKNYMYGNSLDGRLNLSNNRIDYFIMRGASMAFKYPHKLLSRLADEVASYYDLRHPITHKARYAELVDARRMFIFFSLIYLRLNTQLVADYLKQNRTTLSHHLYKAAENIRMYDYDRVIANDIDKFMHELQLLENEA